ncbi:MAG: OmpA family protein [Bacteroidia bacterium]
MFDRRYSTIYYTQCNGADGKSTSCKLFQAKLNGTEWAEEQMLGFCVDDTFDYGHPAITEDGKTMYFSSNRDGGEGGYDIWCVTYNRRAKSWGEPFNLGPGINTESDEMFPYYNDHNGMLYFSSNGHLGMGGLDVFMTEGGGTEWTEPENLRAPLNSGGDDFGMTFDNTDPDHGYFTSNRSGGKGNFDIYEFNIEPLIIEIEGFVYECMAGQFNYDFNLSKPLANSTITITNDKDSTKVVVKTDENGYYGKIRLKEKTNYEINCDNRELYYFDAEPVQRTTVGIKLSTTLKQDFCLKTQITIRTVPIYYDLDKAFIRKDAAQVLDDSILPLLVKYPKLRMELGSHTDCRSSYDYNIALSQRRADSAVAYLVSKGINKHRLIAKGYGESQLVNDCKCEGRVIVPCTEAQHQENRRTTIKTLDVNFDPNMIVEEGSDGNNTNIKTIIVKLNPKGENYLVGAAGNGIEGSGPAMVTAGKDISISINELKKLMSRRLIEAGDLQNITPSEISSGRVRPNSMVKLTTLRFGSKDNANTLTNVNVKIISGAVPYVFGIEALEALDGTLNKDENEMTFKNVNTAALEGGPVDAGGGELEEAIAADTLALDDYSRVTLVSENGNLYVPTMANDKENINWLYEERGRKIEITEDMVIQMLENDVISKKNFDTQGETIRLKDGTKLPSNLLILDKLQIGDVTLENVKVKVNSNIDEPIMGGLYTLLRRNKALMKNGQLFMKPRR